MFYIITHSDVDEHYTKFKTNTVLHVGLGKSDNSAFLFDTTGDSIAEKNPYYCELTGIYWIWKNGTEDPDDFIGIEHYRRLFLRKEYTLLNFLSDEWAHRLLENTEMILPEKFPQPGSVEKQYETWHRKEDLATLRKVMNSLAPDYLDALENVLSREWMYTCNMMICRKSVFDRYCAWLFPILFALEKEIDVHSIDDPYQKRVIGFLAERLLNVWVEKNQISRTELPVLKIGI